MADDAPLVDPALAIPLPIAEPVPAPPVAEPAPTPPTQAERITSAVRLWQTTALTNSPVSRDDVCWRHVESVLPELIALILKEI